MERVILVDVYDTPLGEMEKMEAHRKGLLHRAVSVFVFNSKNKLLLQKRALNKYHSPGLWTNTACTHPFPGESNMDAVIRRLKEEMGLSVKNLTKIFHFTYQEKLDNELSEYEFDHVYIGFSDDEPVPEPNEVSDFKYIDINEVIVRMEKSPKDYTVWFKKIIRQVAIEIQNRHNIR